MFLDLRDAEDFMNRVDRTLKKDSMKLNKEEFDRKAQHILDTVVKPQVEKYEKAKAKSQLRNSGSIYLNKELRREEVAGFTTAIFLSVVIICIIVATIQVIFNIL